MHNHNVLRPDELSNRTGREPLRIPDNYFHTEPSRLQLAINERKVSDPLRTDPLRMIFFVEIYKFSNFHFFSKSSKTNFSNVGNFEKMKILNFSTKKVLKGS